MTNAEKYLKEGTDIAELSQEICKYIDKNYGLIVGNKYGLADFFKKEAKPTLTEDERVILRNINCRYNRIRKVKEPDHLQLQVFDQYDKVWETFTFNHLFQFIKERRRI